MITTILHFQQAQDTQIDLLRLRRGEPSSSASSPASSSPSSWSRKLITSTPGCSSSSSSQKDLRATTSPPKSKSESPSEGGGPSSSGDVAPSSSAQKSTPSRDISPPDSESSLSLSEPSALAFCVVGQYSMFGPKRRGKRTAREGMTRKGERGRELSPTGDSGEGLGELDDAGVLFGGGGGALPSESVLVQSRTVACAGVACTFLATLAAAFASVDSVNTTGALRWTPPKVESSRASMGCISREWESSVGCVSRETEVGGGVRVGVASAEFATVD
ncbi:hypothetical protein C8R46DRAFT_1275233, partial [Mycena filopes]